MPIFNSLGSNYHTAFVGRSLVPRFKDRSLELKNRLQKDYGAKDVLLSYKGRQAIFAAIKALDLPAGSKIAVNGYTCYAVYQAIDAAGLVPHYIDISERSLNFSADDLETVLKQKSNDISAVMIQNTLGYPVEIEAIAKLCKQHKIPLIEDLAHSIGLSYQNGREAGTVGDAAALSFSQDKVVDAISGGALIWHKRKKLNLEVRRLDLFDRWRDWSYPILTLTIRNTYSVVIGKVIQKLFKNLRLMSRPMDGRADVIQSLTPWHTSRILDQWQDRHAAINHRQHIAEVYQRRLPQHIQLPHIQGATYIRFPILVENRTELIDFLKKQDVHISDIWYEAPLSPSRLIPSTNYLKGSCPNAEKLSELMLNLPTHANISVDAAARIAEGVNQWLSNTPR